jgi:hypothetical protein
MQPTINQPTEMAAILDSLSPESFSHAFQAACAAAANNTKAST